MYFDPLYLIISFPILLLGIFASIFLRIIYGINSRKVNNMNVNGIETVSRIAQHYNYSVELGQTFDNLGDNYNPLSRLVTLSNDVAHRPTIASVGIAAHEMGHVAQHNSSFFLITIRTSIAPVVNIGSNLGYVLFFIGLMFSIANLAWLGILLFSLTTVFALITLPIEIDASRRAIKMIKELHLVDDANIGSVRMVLFAAAFTYVAALVQSSGNLLYFILRAQGIGKRD